MQATISTSNPAATRWCAATCFRRAAIRKAKGFAIVEENKLKRVPTGFPADSEYAEMLKLKDFYIAKKITEEFLLADDLLEKTLAEFRRTQPFIAILNRAVQFAYEEMM